MDATTAQVFTVQFELKMWAMVNDAVGLPVSFWGVFSPQHTPIGESGERKLFKALSS